MANYKFAIPFYLKKEGGLSRAATDSASRNPSPCVIRGVTGWHTNKGVTWGSFTGNAGKVGYSPSCGNFAAMPQSIWQGIFKKSYWNFWDSDSIPYQSIADFMTWSVWGSGGGSFSRGTGSQGFLKRFVQSQGYSPQNKSEIRAALMHMAKRNEKATWLKMIQARRDFYVRLNQPANIRGWNNALDKYVKWGDEHYSFSRINWKLIAWIGIPAVLIGSAAYLYKTEVYDKRRSIAP